MAEGLKQKAINGVMWSAIERFSVQGVSFVLSIIIARLVLPSEYGLIAMLGIFLAIAQSFIDSGFTQALIHKQNRTDVDFSTVFYFNLAVSVGVYTLLFFAAPFIAKFYNEPQLEILSKWIGLSLIISGLTIVQRAKLTINLDFKTQAKASLTSVVIGGAIGVYLAYNGYGVWALVVQSLVRAAVETILLWIIAHWRPPLVFSIDSFKTLFSFGSKLLAGGLLHTIYTNLYSLVIGRYYNAADVGYYNRSCSLVQFPSINITTVVARAIYPLQCQVQDDDKRLSDTFIQYLRMSCYVIFPLMIGLAVLAKPLVLLILTDKWLPAAELVSILSIAYMLQPIMYLNWQLLTVKGRTDLTFKSEIVKKVVAISTLLTTMSFGLQALCLGVILYSLLDVVIIISYVRKIVPSTGYRLQVTNIIPLMALSVAMGIIIFVAKEFISDTPIIQLIAGTTVGIISYILFSIMFKFKEMETIKSLLKR